ncbi:MAG: hypothetical protein ABFS39_18920 [Pseudomonadota bacterium]
MKKILSITIVAFAFFCFQVFAHHASVGVVDDEIYEMIDELVSEVHASMTLEDLAFGMTEMTIVVEDADALEALMDGGLLSYIDALNGDTTIIITETPDGGYIITIITRGENFG